jgi:hypothetical protein
MTEYYVNSAATGAADGSSEADAWTTIDTAMNNVVAGDKVWVKANSGYTEVATIDTNGAFANPIVFEGYTTSTGDNGLVTHNAATSNACIVGPNASAHYIFKNFDWNGSTGSLSCVNCENTDNLTFVNCKAHDSSVYGFNVDQNCMFINCEAYSNTFYGFHCDNGSKALGCVAHSNGWEQFNCATDWRLLYKCVAYNPGSSRDLIRSQGNDISDGVIGCTLDGDNTSGCTGIEATGETDAVFVDNIIYDCDTGLDVAATWYETAGALIGYNLVNSNTTDYSTTQEELVGHNDVTSAPSFTDEAGDDYTLGGSSPAIDAGLTPGTY